MEITTLKDLENKKTITLSHGFGGWNTMDMETGLNNILLENTELVDNNTVLKLIGRTIRGSEVNGYIRSNNSELLKEIKDEIGKLIPKSISISEIYFTKLNIGLDI